MIKIGDKTYMEIKEYSEFKGKSIQTIYNWIKGNSVKTRKLMGKILIEL